MDGFDAFVHERTQRVYILLITRGDEDAVFAKSRHPSLLQILQRVILAGHGGQIVLFLGCVREVVDLVEDDDAGDRAG